MTMHTKKLSEAKAKRMRDAEEAEHYRLHDEAAERVAKSNLSESALEVLNERWRRLPLEERANPRRAFREHLADVIERELQDELARTANPNAYVRRLASDVVGAFNWYSVLPPVEDIMRRRRWREQRV